MNDFYLPDKVLSESFDLTESIIGFGLDALPLGGIIGIWLEVGCILIVIGGSGNVNLVLVVWYTEAECGGVGWVVTNTAKNNRKSN